MEHYKNKLGSLADRLKQEPSPTPIQQVLPVTQARPDKEEEAQLNTWIPKELLRRMKSYGVEHDLSLKDINIQALRFFLDAAKDQEH